MHEINCVIPLFKCSFGNWEKL